MKRIGVACCLCLLFCVQCAKTPYRSIENLESPLVLKLQQKEAQIEKGHPVRPLDALGHYLFSLPSKILLWNWSVDNHDISQETEDALLLYLRHNHLNNVKVRLNQYEPRAEWRRLIRNKAVAPGWRYTLGFLSWLQYVAFPGRLFGGDNYNPYTNTINLYSDHVGIALHEAGHAKDFNRYQRPANGWYAFIYMLPLAPLYYEAQATGDTIGYLRATHMQHYEKQSYKILYPAYCTYIAGEGLRWAPVQIWVRYAVLAVAVVPGHIVGRIKAARVD